MNNLQERTKNIAAYMGLRFALHCPKRRGIAIADFQRDVPPIMRQRFIDPKDIVDFTDMQIWEICFEIGKEVPNVDYRAIAQYMEHAAGLCDEVAAGSLTLDQAFAKMNERGAITDGIEGLDVQ